MRATIIAVVPFVLASFAGLFVSGCDRSAPPPETVTLPGQPIEPATATSRDFGDYVLYFNAIRTDSLTPEIARTYGITRSANRALLNISMIREADGTTGTPVPGVVAVETVNLNGQFKDLNVREIREGNAIYYIGDVPVSNDETLLFTVDATPEGAEQQLSVRFQRQFLGGAVP
jgi:hypothetical protein